jgi:hypothetical protein
MKRKITSLLFCASVIFASCGGGSSSKSENSQTIENTDSLSDSKQCDSVIIPTGLSKEDSIAIIENCTTKSPISVSDYLGLAEVHSIEGCINYYDYIEKAKNDPEYAMYLPTHRDSAAMRLANHFMRMNYVAMHNGNAKDKLQWAMAVNAVIDTFCVSMPSIAKDSVLNEITRIVGKYSSGCQFEMNFECYVSSSIDYYRTIESYRQFINAVPSSIKSLVQKEYEAWHDLNNARFVLWRDVSYMQEWYSMKPMEIEGYFEYLSRNRRAELDVERYIILFGKTYQQKGKTITNTEWKAWIAKSSVPEDIDDLKAMGETNLIPSDSIVIPRVNELNSTFTKWIQARKNLSAALPKEQGRSYDCITADIHSRIIGKLAPIVPYAFRHSEEE